jgi:hypothetical protein
MKAVNIKGTDYITVNERLKYFTAAEDFIGWSIHETVVELNDKEGVFKVAIKDEQNNVMAEAHAQEYRDSSYINKTSFLENGFTSALGRALGYLGIGIDAAIASADEVSNAVNNQKEDTRPWLNEQQFHATLQGTPEQAQKVLKSFRMKKDYATEIRKIFKL